MASLKIALLVGAVGVGLNGCAMTAHKIDERIQHCGKHEQLTVVSYKHSGAVAAIHCAPQLADVDVSHQRKRTWIEKLLGLN